MKTADAVAKIKLAVHDRGNTYSTAECINLLNTAIQEASAILIAGGSPLMVSETVLHDGDVLPDNFMRPAGTYPIRRTGYTVSFLDDTTEMRFRYFATKDNLEDSSGSLPFIHDAVNESVLRLAIIMALNENEFDCAQDSALLNELKSAIAQGMGG